MPFVFIEHRAILFAFRDRIGALRVVLTDENVFNCVGPETDGDQLPPTPGCSPADRGRRQSG
jgi:hypothetical protein